MNDTVMSVIAIFLAAVLMFVFPLMATADRSDDISQQAVQTATTEFVDNIRATGKITQAKYDNFVSTIAETGNTFDVEIEAQKLDDTARKKTTQAKSSKVGENNYYRLSPPNTDINPVGFSLWRERHSAMPHPKHMCRRHTSRCTTPTHCPSYHTIPTR